MKDRRHYTASVENKSNVSFLETEFDAHSLLGDKVMYFDEKCPTEFLELKTSEQKDKNCSCLVSKSFFRNEENWYLLRKQCLKQKRNISKSNFLRSTCLPKHVTFRFCFCILLTWSLLVAPILNDILRQTLPVSSHIFFGGVTGAEGCQPGRVPNGASRPRSVINLTPFQLNEHVPKVSEQTIGASGPAEGPIFRDSQRYKDELIPNFNPSIVFRDEEQTNEDRMMTQLCKDRLDDLAIWVNIQWPGVRLRVTEAWIDISDTNFAVPEEALHYEGRAVDITTSDQDRHKYKLLARLAVEAGFDWVLYKDSYVHCSVKSASSDAARSRGCFPGDSRVQIPGGTSVRMDELRAGDSVYSVDSNGNIVQDTILTFMDIRTDIVADEQASRHFVLLETESGHSLRLTRNHLIHASKKESVIYSSPSVHSSTAIFAGNVKKGDYVYVLDSSEIVPSNGTVRPTKVINLDVVVATSGAYAPLTNEGTILIQGTMASCYAVFENDYIAHLVMTPARVYHKAQNWVFSRLTPQNSTISTNFGVNQFGTEGIMPYADFLYRVAQKFIPEPWFWGD